MKILWEFASASGYIWLEYTLNGATHIKRFTQEGFEQFMLEHDEEYFLG